MTKSPSHTMPTRARPDVSVVVVNRDRAELLGDCLRSVEADTAAALRAGVSVESIVVDNGSSDASCTIVRERFPAMQLVALDANTGFAGGVMHGIERSTGEWVLTLNNDAQLLPGAIAALVQAARSADDVGAVAAQLRFARDGDTINSAGIEIDRLGVASDRLLGRPASASEQTVCEVFGASAGAALYRRRMLDELGGFDPSFFAFLEDADLAWRARMAGWRTLYQPSAVVLHHHSATARHGSPFKHRLVGRNRVLLLARNATRGQLARNGAAMVAYDVAYVGWVLLVQRDLAPLRGRIEGIREWRAARASGAQSRRPLQLPRSAGVRGALRRRRAWGSR